MTNAPIFIYYLSRDTDKEAFYQHLDAGIGAGSEDFVFVQETGSVHFARDQDRVHGVLAMVYFLDSLSERKGMDVVIPVFIGSKQSEVYIHSLTPDDIPNNIVFKAKMIFEEMKKADALKEIFFKEVQGITEGIFKSMLPSTNTVDSRFQQLMGQVNTADVMLKSIYDWFTCVVMGKQRISITIETHQEKVANQFGFKLTHHILELYGVCPDCQTT